MTKPRTRIGLKIKLFLRKRVLPKGLLARSFMMIIVPVVLLQLVVAVLFYQQHWQIISKRMAMGIAGDISYVLDLAQEAEVAGDTEALLTLFNKASRNMDIHFVKTKRAVLPENNIGIMDNEVMVDELARQLEKEVGYNFTVTEGARKKTVTIYMNVPNMGIMAIVVPTKRFFSSTAYVFPAWMLGSAILLFGVAWAFMRIQVRSIRRLAKAADEFGKGYDSPYFKPEGAAEVRQAATAFISMRNRIKRQLDERTAMLAGVSHDLRTPLTRMKLQLSMMKKNADTEMMLSDIADMEKMLNGYLAFAKGEGKEQPKLTQVADVLKELVFKMRRNMPAIDLHIEQEQEMMIRPNDFARAITNLLGNAARYAKQAVVRMGVRDNALEIIVDDDGKGIPKTHREDVFKAFYRVDSSRNQQTGGVGLGLTITRDIVLAHGGKITLEDSPLGGLRVRLSFPI